MSIRVAIWPSGTRVTWRSLSWGEYRKIKSLPGPPAEKALEVYTLCVTEGPRPDEIAAGIMMWLSQYELDSSPFSGSFQTLSGPLQQIRDKVSSTYLLSAQAFIAAVFKIPFEKMDEWDSDTFLTRIAQAEFMSGVPLNPVDPMAIKSGKSKIKQGKKPLTNAQQIAIDRRFGAGAAEKYNANSILKGGGKPSQQEDKEVETFTYTNDKVNRDGTRKTG
jgi:hypothetical protein